MSVGHYSFLPWLRRGIANQLETPATAASRASLAVTVRVKSETGALDVPPRPVLLVGPGDLIGINQQMVLRTEPRPGIADFEPNYLAYIDFYDEDFAWRYTPAPPDAAKHRLPPWLTLLVLKEDEFKTLKRRPLPAIDLTGGAVLTTIVPPDEELWAWAHVHLNATLTEAGAPNLDVLGTLLRQNPDAGYCRLLSPRRLAPNTAYHAFVVPTFEVGRLAGLGVTPPDTMPGLTTAFVAGRTFPVYVDWCFSTGAAGDFESLVTALKSRDIDKRVGIREMDVQQPGFHVLPTTGQPDDVVGLEGVLLAPTTVHVPVDPACTLPANLAAEVNRPDDEQTAGVADGDVPLVSVPLYGRWHAFVERVAPFAEHRTWINELNTDPRFRAVAGMGTQVIQKNQEGYMKLACEQIGDVLALNSKITFLQLSVKASDALYTRQLAPMVTERALAIAAPVMTKVLGSPITVHALVEQSRLPRAALSGAMRKQLRPRGQLARRTFGAPGAVDPLARTMAGLNSGELTAAPPRPAPSGLTYEGALAAVAPTWPAWLRWLATHRWVALIWFVILLLAILMVLPSIAMLVILAVGGVAVAAVALTRLTAIAHTLDTVADFAPTALTPEAIAALPPNDVFVMPPDDASGTSTTPAPAPGGGPDSPQGAAFRVAAIELAARISDRPAPLPIRAPLVLAAVRNTMLAALRPAPAFVARHDVLLAVGGRPLSAYLATYHDAPKVGSIPPPGLPDPRIVPVMAYPDIKLPMYRPLKDLQKDNFVPNLHLVPSDTISLMLTNPPVIESYMVGLNHEFARELLWREYPTDQRPSTFRQFWDPSNYVDTDKLSAKDLAEKVRDIKRIHEWPADSVLGTHRNQQPDDGKPRVVLIIRGELLKRYPHTIIYAQQARWGDPPKHTNHLTLYDETGEKADPDLKDPHFRFPLFRAFVEPDLYFIGFDLLLDEVRGDPKLAETPEAHASIDPAKLGWFFVLQEVVGEPRFGLDEHAVTESDDTLMWDNLSWENLGAAVPLIRMTPLAVDPPGPLDGGARWGTHAADLAFILYQRPVLVAVHARKMLENVKSPT
jgi:hypothetical protein